VFNNANRKAFAKQNIIFISFNHPMILY
jgi:hypothetical protein